VGFNWFYSYIADAGVMYGVWKYKVPIGGVYSVTIAFSVYFAYREAQAARVVLKEKLLARILMNDSATRYWVMRDYRFFCLKTQIEEHLHGDDRRSLNIFTTLSAWRVLFFVQIPQLLILCFAWGYATGQCPQPNSATAQNAADCSYLDKIDDFTIFGYVFKMVISGLALINLVIALLQYVLVKCRLFIKFRSSIMTFRKYVAYTLDRIFGVLVSLNPKILLMDERNDDTPGGCCESTVKYIEHAKKSIKNPYQTGELQAAELVEVNMAPAGAPVAGEVIIVTQPVQPQIVVLAPAPQIVVTPPVDQQVVVVTMASQEVVQQGTQQA